jgi:hypothetical protein
MGVHGAHREYLPDCPGRGEEAERRLIQRPPSCEEPIVWVPEDGAYRATIGPWTACVARTPAARWEWRAFASGGRNGARALGGGAFAAHDAAQRDAEVTLASRR